MLGERFGELGNAYHIAELLEAAAKAYDLAVKHFSRALTLDPAADSLHYPLAQVYMKLGDEERARQHLERRGDRPVGTVDPLADRLSQSKTLTAFSLIESLAGDPERLGDEDFLGFVAEQRRSAWVTMIRFRDSKKPWSATSAARWSGCHRRSCHRRAGGWSQQLQQRQCHHFRGVDHILYAAPFVGLVGLDEDPGAISNAAFDIGDAGDVFVIVGAGAGDELRTATENGSDGPIQRLHQGILFRRQSGVDDHHVLDLVAAGRIFGGDRIEQLDDFFAGGFEALLHQESSVENGLAVIGHAGRLNSFAGLAAGDGVDIERSASSLGWDDRHGGMAILQGWAETSAEGLEHRPHLLDRIDT